MMSSSGSGYATNQGRSITEMSNIRDEQEERLRLEKANFDLKMKLFYLENNSRRVGSSGMMEESDSYPSSGNIPSDSLLHVLEEKSYELEQRNQLLVRAKLAIEALKIELEKCRVDGKRYSDEIDNELRISKIENDEISYKHHENALIFESQMIKANNIIAKKDQLRIVAEEKLVRNILHLFIFCHFSFFDVLFSQSFFVICSL